MQKGGTLILVVEKCWAVEICSKDYSTSMDPPKSFHGFCNVLIWIGIYMELLSLTIWSFIFFKQLFRAANLFVIDIHFSK